MVGSKGEGEEERTCQLGRREERKRGRGMEELEGWRHLAAPIEEATADGSVTHAMTSCFMKRSLTKLNPLDDQDFRQR